MEESKDAVRALMELADEFAGRVEARLNNNDARSALESAIRAALQASRSVALKEAAKEVPDTWLDPLLSGPDRVVIDSPANDIEGLLDAVRARIRALAAKDGR